MGLIILRCVFILVAAGLGVSFLQFGVLPKDSPPLAWGVFCGLLLLALGVIVADVSVRRKRLDIITAVYFGMLVGLFLTYILGLAMVPLLGDKLRMPVQSVLGLVLCYVCISLLMQTRNDFRFIIPYIEFAKEI
jgi:purine-cytosine permease-like protein